MENHQNDNFPELPKPMRLDGESITPLENVTPTTAKTWLKMDLEMQSGAIWTDDKDGSRDAEKEKNYSLPNSKPFILKPDSVKYGNIEITPNVGQIID